MKKVLGLIIVLLVLFSLNAYDFDSSSRHTSMGGTGLSDTSDAVNFFSNPAIVSLYGDSQYRLLVSAGVKDSFLFNSGEPFPTDPDSYLKAQILGKNISAGISVDFDLTNRVPGQEFTYYDSIKQFESRISVAVSIGHFSGGIGLEISSSWKKLMINVNKNNTIPDLIRECYFSPHFRSQDSSSLNLIAGLMYSIDSFAFGFKLDNIVSYEESEVLFDWDTFKNGMSISLGYNPDMLTRRGRLKPVICAFAVEADNFLDETNGMLRLGGEISLQLARNHSVSARMGYFSHISMITRGSITGGLGYRYHNVDIALETVLPTSVFSSRDERFTIGLSATLMF